MEQVSDQVEIKLNEYQEISDEKYHSIKAISSHGIPKILKSPKHFLTSQNHKKEPSESMLFGSACHIMALQPDRFSYRVKIRPDFDKRSKTGKAAFEEWARQDHSKDTIFQPESNMREIEAMQTELNDCQTFIQLRTAAIHIEKAIFRQDPDCFSGHLLKAKPDLIGPDFILDYKTTQSIETKDFMSSIAKFNYHIQAAFYIWMDSLVNNCAPKNFIIVAQENELPYSVRIFQLDQDAINRGMELISIANQKWNKSILLNDPDYNKNEIKQIGLPLWAMSNIHDEV